MHRIYKQLTRQIPLSEIFPYEANLLYYPNYQRIPLSRAFFEAQFCARNFGFFGTSWTSFLSLLLVIWYCRAFDPAPNERIDRYWLHSPKFRILVAQKSPGRRPGYAIAFISSTIRYIFRGLDHSLSINERKDLLFKLKESYLVEINPTIQYPYLFRQLNKVHTKDPHNIHIYSIPRR